jgi:hypothetical protein
MNLRATICEDMDWMYLAQGRGRWRARVKTAMNLPVLIKGGEFLY